jgi:hypothetical protein
MSTAKWQNIAGSKKFFNLTSFFLFSTENPSVFMVAPFTTRDLNQRCMADVIFDLTELTTLYPTIPKDSFKDFVTTKAPSSSSGYVNHNLVTRVEGGG